jgi:hypothetical protein
MRGHDAIHPSLLAPIVGAALGGPYEGRPKRIVGGLVRRLRPVEAAGTG